MCDPEMALRHIFQAATKSVLPHTRIRNLLKIHENQLEIQDQVYEIPKQGVTIVGFGKAVIGMAAQLQRQLSPEQIKLAILSVPHGISSQLISSGQKIQIPCPQPGLFLNEGAKNNIPDSNSLKTSQMISETVSDLKSSDLVIVLVSGGGSALLPAPKPPLTLEEKAKLTAKLSKAGASIQELNSVRIQLSQLKGGKLAVKAQPATGDKFPETFLLFKFLFFKLF